MNFCPGQRIKKVRGVYNIGNTATVTRVETTGTVLFTYVIADQPCVTGDGEWYPAGREWFIADESQWEPIIPEGLEAPERIAELWEPSPEVVKS